MTAFSKFELFICHRFNIVIYTGIMFSEDANTDEEKNVPLYSRCIVLLWCFSD